MLRLIRHLYSKGYSFKGITSDFKRQCKFVFEGLDLRIIIQSIYIEGGRKDKIVILALWESLDELDIHREYFKYFKTFKYPEEFHLDVIVEEIIRSLENISYAGNN